MSVRIRIPLPTSGYSAQLVGIAGTRTSGETVAGAYDAAYSQHEFEVSVAGNYILQVDAAGGSSWSTDTDWSDANGNFISGDDLDNHLNGHGTGVAYKIATDDIEDEAVTPSKTSFMEDF